MAPFSCEAQAIISRETSRRAERLTEIFAGAAKRSRNGRVIVLAGSRFNLGDLSNVALRSALLAEGNDSSFVPFDPDHPLTASPLALAEAAAEADAIVAADLFRSDLPGIVAPQTAWITWLTNGRIVAPDPQNPMDGLLLADPQWRQSALDGGWPAERVRVAAWPCVVPPPNRPHSTGIVGLLTDIRAIEIPQHVKDFSSQLLLWEMIENELSNRPLSLGGNPEEYLLARMKRFNIADEGFDRALFFRTADCARLQNGTCAFFVARRDSPGRLRTRLERNSGIRTRRQRLHRESRQSG